MMAATDDVPIRPRVVVVDDDEIQRCLVDAFLGNDYEVIGFGDAKQALAAILEDRPAVVVSDVHMPGMDGAALLACLDEAGINVPFVFLSGEDPASAGGLASMACLSAHVWRGMLRKPIDPVQLRETLAAMRACQRQ